MIPKPLKGITVVEMGTVEAEGIASLLLSDYGARVIRLEMVFPEQKNSQTNSFRICDRGKERILFRPDRKEDRNWFEQQIKKTDALITSVPKKLLSQWHMDSAVLCVKNPGLVYTSITGYGQSGPWGEGHPYNEITIQAESGLMSITGEEHGEPVRCGGDFAVFAGGLNACIATLMALIDRNRSGRGRVCDVSMMDSIIYGLENQFSLYLKSGVVPVPMGNHYALSAPVGDYCCRDGKKLMISVATEPQWNNFAEAVGHREWLEDEDYRNVQSRLKHYKKLEKDVAAAFMEYTSEELVRRLQSKNCIYGTVNDFKDVARHPQTEARHMLISVRVPDGDQWTVPSNPLVMDGEKPAGHVILDTKMCQNNDTDNSK